MSLHGIIPGLSIHTRKLRDSAKSYFQEKKDNIKSYYSNLDLKNKNFNPIRFYNYKKCQKMLNPIVDLEKRKRIYKQCKEMIPIALKKRKNNIKFLDEIKNEIYNTKISEISELPNVNYKKLAWQFMSTGYESKLKDKPLPLDLYNNLKNDYEEQAKSLKLERAELKKLKKKLEYVIITEELSKEDKSYFNQLITNNPEFYSKLPEIFAELDNINPNTINYEGTNLFRKDLESIINNDNNAQFPISILALDENTNLANIIYINEKLQLRGSEVPHLIVKMNNSDYKKNKNNINEKELIDYFKENFEIPFYPSSIILTDGKNSRLKYIDVNGQIRGKEEINNTMKNSKIEYLNNDNFKEMTSLEAIKVYNSLKEECKNIPNNYLSEFSKLINPIATANSTFINTLKDYFKINGFEKTKQWLNGLTN